MSDTPQTRQDASSAAKPAAKARRTMKRANTALALDGGAKPATARGPSLRQMAGLPNERQLQGQIVEGLERLGYVVREVGKWQSQVQCPHCDVYFSPRIGMPNTPGTPDLYVSRPGRNLWVGLELKTPAVKTVLGTVKGGRVRKAQKELTDQGVTNVIRSLEEALDVLEAAGL